MSDALRACMHESLLLSTLHLNFNVFVFNKLVCLYARVLST